MIRLDGVGKRYPDGTVAVHDLDLTVARGELVALVGPSGCGKSTTLRMVNRLVEPTSGRILLGGADVTKEDPVELRRGIGYVIQRVGLFPHLTVRENVATVPKLLGWDRARITERTDHLLELVGLDAGVYGDRYPHALSGGQQQRVGVARALAADPPVLLMDEPFGAVDPQQRQRLQTEFRALQQELGTTVLFVTHDIDEAVRLADRIAVFGTGYLAQVATPAELLAAPASEEVADFVGADRGIRRMSVIPLSRSHLVPASGSRPVSDDRVLHLGIPLRDAFLALVASNRSSIAVVDPDDGGRRVGTLTPEAILTALREVPAPASPQAGETGETG
jgi:osmoprotectant transport system ATP-binding protein